MKGIWKKGATAKTAEDFVSRRLGNGPSCYLCGESLGNMTLEEHFETCDGRPTLNDDVQMKKVRTKTIDWASRYDVPSLTNTGDIGTDYNNIKAIKYPEKEEAAIKSPPRKVLVETDSRPKYITQYGTTAYGTAPRYIT